MCERQSNVILISVFSSASPNKNVSVVGEDPSDSLVAEFLEPGETSDVYIIFQIPENETGELVRGSAFFDDIVGVFELP